MTIETRRRIFRYGVAVDLVILAIGVGMLYPLTDAAMLAVFFVAILLAAWKGGWQGGLTAIAGSELALLLYFRLPALPVAGLAVAGIMFTAIIRALRRPAESAEEPEIDVARVLTFEREAPPPVPAPAPPAPPVQPAVSLQPPAAPKRAKQFDADTNPAFREVESVTNPAFDVELERRIDQRLAVERRTFEERMSIERAAFEVRLEQAVAKERRAGDARLAAERDGAARVASELVANQRAALERERISTLAAERAKWEEETDRRVDAARAEAQREHDERHAALAREHEEKLAAERARWEAEAGRRLEEALAEARTEFENRRTTDREHDSQAIELKLAVARDHLQREHEMQRAEWERKAEERLAEQRTALEHDFERRVTELRASLGQDFERRMQERLHAERERWEEGAEVRREVGQEADRAQWEHDLEERLAAERVRWETEANESLTRERELWDRSAEERLELERAAMESAKEREVERLVEERMIVEREKLQRHFDEQRAAAEKVMLERIAADRAELEKRLEERRRSQAAAATPPRSEADERQGLLGALAGLFGSPQRPRQSVNLNSAKVAGNDTAARRRVAAMQQRRTGTPRTTPERRPRLLMLEKRRGTADTAVPRLRQRGIEVQIVERLIDAVDELFRFRPDVLFVDTELPEFERIFKTITEQTKLPIFLTGRSPQGVPDVPHVGYVTRPYDPAALIMIAEQAFADSGEKKSEAPERPSLALVPTPAAVMNEEGRGEQAPQPYEVTCYNCGVSFEASEADWCSCLAKERSLVCTNCLTCFCKAPPAYKEKFWMEAPQKLFERKTSELRKRAAVSGNPPPETVARPLVLLVEDDEDVQVIVQRVCNNLGYGFVSAPNGQEGLNIAHQYRPDLILSDAFMPKLDGREMCRMLKEEQEFATTKMVVMTGLYTDTKYKSEALRRFHIDDYLSKPVAVTDLINLLQRHLEGVTGLPLQEDLHELHRRATLEQELPAEMADVPAVSSSRDEEYEICCVTCGKIFDAAKAEWCTCLGRDQTMVCTYCGNCFCKAPVLYRERFWADAPPVLYERKIVGSRRNEHGRKNPSREEAKRPLILLVEDDENIQLIVKTVVTTMGYGFIVAADGQEGLEMAREYSPDLILSDAFMPKLDGREMCRILKEDPATSSMKAIIMTGLYTDRKYRNEALAYFKVDDYVAKPVAVDDLIRLMKKHLPQDVQATM